MINHKQHRNRNYYAVLAMLLVFFATPIFAVELQGVQPRSYRFEVRLASFEPMEGWENLPFNMQKKTIWVSPEAALTNTDVFQAEAGHTIDDKACVNLMLTEEGALKLARLTMAHVGQFLAILIDGRVTAIPQIMAEITGGRARLDGNFTEEEAKSIAEGIMIKGY